ncbi:Hypothetical protein D9617_5g070130 [Elsinoe fawcettii]|nr:Hypothetical protein D9617_5g070130 [Elsinoe fawcettii]
MSNSSATVSPPLTTFINPWSTLRTSSPSTTVPYFTQTRPALIGTYTLLPGNVITIPPRVLTLAPDPGVSRISVANTTLYAGSLVTDKARTISYPSSFIGRQPADYTGQVLSICLDGRRVPYAELAVEFPEANGSLGRIGVGLPTGGVGTVTVDLSTAAGPEATAGGGNGTGGDETAAGTTGGAIGREAGHSTVLAVGLGWVVLPSLAWAL